MPPLPSDLRNKLERAIIDARDIAEAGAQAALETMAVHHYDPYPSQTPEQRKLRNHLRAHARQLGDQQDSNGKLHIAHLIHECAYEHWHRMLFARFLAENDLLIEPSYGTAISLQECEELAKKAKTDLWTIASRCAQQMLPQIFRPDDPLLQVTLAREYRGKLEALLNDLPQAVFKADDALGWVYQFWQSKKKDEVNASEKKITGDTLPAVTQLFTEHYMVLFLLHNTIGAWHAGKVLAANPKLAEKATNEDELRLAVALKSAGGYSFDYLRFVRGLDGKEGPWRPAAGTFEGWPKHAAELKALDPCCGSGHFLVALFELLLRLRMDEEGLAPKDAANAVLRDNIFALELDARCTQIAAFNLALAAWRHGGYRSLPSLHIACSGLGVNAKKETWIKLAKGNERLVFPLGQLWELFQKAPVLGSLINPNLLPRVQIGNAPSFSDLRPMLDKALALEGAADDDAAEIAVAAQGVARAAEILASHFTLVITNVPYLGRGKQDDVLKEYCARVHADSKADLATCFIERCLDFCAAGGTTALVTPQNWLFLGTYKGLRKTILSKASWEHIAWLGAGAFETISGEAVNVCLLSLTLSKPSADQQIMGIDAAAEATPHAKSSAIQIGPIRLTLQHLQQANPDSRVMLETRGDVSRLSAVVRPTEGLSTGDRDRFVHVFWEHPIQQKGWQFLRTGSDDDALFTGMQEILLWEDGQGDLSRAEGARIQGDFAWGKNGVIISRVNSLRAGLYSGELFDKSCVVLTPSNAAIMPALLTMCASIEFRREVRVLDKKPYVTTATFGQVPFDADHWQRIAAEKYAEGLPSPRSDDPTQWLFTGDPRAAEESLQVAVARLLGYQWPRQTGSSFPDCPALKSDGLEKFSNDDGIVCIPSIRAENPAADRLAALLEACGIKPGRDLDDWLRNSFFEEHCKLFHHHPFIWHIWDGREDVPSLVEKS